MNKLVTVTAALLVSLATYACSGDDENAPDEAAGATAGQGGRGSGTAGTSGGPTIGGASGRGGTNGGAAGSPSGGARPTGGAAGSTWSVGGVAGNSGTLGFAGLAAAGRAGVGSSVGTIAGAGGSAGGGGIAGGISSGGLAGGSAGVAGTLTIPVAGSGAAAGANTAGTTGSSGSGSGGIAGASNASCNALCGTRGCSTQPACLAKAYGYAEGDAIPLCVPMVTQSGVTLCGVTTCNGDKGCPMKATLGTTTWTLSAGSATRSTDVRLDTMVTSLTGPITATGALNCTLNATLPTGGVPIAATGVAAPAPANPALMALTFDQIDAPLTGIGVSSTDSFCVSLVNAFVANALPIMRAAMLDGINARAAVLSCLECRDDCPEQLACIAPEP